MSLGASPVTHPNLSIDSLSELGSLKVSSLTDGDLVYVRDTDQFWRLSLSSTEPTSSWTHSCAMGGRWLLLIDDALKLAWAEQTDWEINSSTGSDYATGLPGAPLRTYAELRRRLQYAPVAFTATVTVTGPTLDQIIIDQSFPVDSKLYIVGQKTIVGSGTFDAVTTKLESANRLYTLSSANFNMTAHEGKLLDIVHGNQHCSAVILKSLGGTNVRASNVIKKTTTVFETGVTEVVPAIADTFDVVTCPTTTIPYITAGVCEYAIEWMEFTEPSFSYSNDYAVMCFGTFWNCKFHDYFEVYGDATVYFNGCCWYGPSGSNYSYLDVYDAARLYIQAGGMIGNGVTGNAYIGIWSSTARVLFDYSFGFQNAFLTADRGGAVTIRNACAFDCTTNALYVGNGGSINFPSSSGYLFGTSSTIATIYFGSNTAGQYGNSARITVTAAGSIFSFHGTAKNVVDLPFAESVFYTRLIAA